MPELQITLASGQAIDFFEHLATPYPLIIFDHIELHAHKKHELPKHPPCSYDDSEATITNKFC